MIPSLLFFSTLCFLSIVDNVSALDPIPSLNVSSYLGRWYQAYADPLITNTFEKNGVCITADYGLINSTYIRVLNSQRIKTIDGPIKNITGYAYQANPKIGGALKVRLQGGAPFDAPYTIIDIGPIINNQYQWSIISDPLGAGLFVLSRDIPTFELLYENEILLLLQKYGFTKFYNKPIKTLHTGCTYPWKTPSNYHKTIEQQ